MFKATHLHGFSARSGSSVITSPSQLAGMLAWYKANEITGSDGDHVNLTDASANGNDAVNGTSGFRPVLRTSFYNSLNVVEFISANLYALTTPDMFTGHAESCAFVVYRSTDTSNNRALWNIGSQSGSNTLWPYSGDGKIYDSYGSTTRHGGANPVDAMTGWNIYYVSSKASEWIMRQNSSLLITDTTNTVGYDTTPTIGRDYADANNLSGYVGEMIFYSTIPSAADRLSVEQLLATKWAITLH